MNQIFINETHFEFLVQKIENEDKSNQGDPNRELTELNMRLSEIVGHHIGWYAYYDRDPVILSGGGPHILCEQDSCDYRLTWIIIPTSSMPILLDLYMPV